MDKVETNTKRLKLLSDFNLDVLSGYLVNQLADTHKVISTGYNQLWNVLGEPVSEEGKSSDASFVWARPEAVSPSFARALMLERVTFDEVQSDIDHFADLVLRHAEGMQYCFVASFVLPSEHWGYGMLDWQPGVGLAHVLAQSNLHLSSRFAEAKNLFMLDAERWMRVANASSPKLWYAAKVPFANSVFKEAAAAIKAALNALTGLSRRLIIVDLDGTLWGGIVGETGWEGLRLGGHDLVGEAFQDFQRALKAQTARGIQLAIVSKNQESVALAAIDSHPEMLLKRTDFAGWRINWDDKAANIVSLLEELNLGAGSAVFIDDNPAERDRVRGAVPNILIPEWPNDPCFFVQAFNSLKCFDAAAVTDEDRARTHMYVQDRARRETIKIHSESDWLSTMETVVTLENVTPKNIARVEQILNKTNQMNLTTRRLSAAQILEWNALPNRRMYVAKVSDRFGDIGLSGLISVDVTDGEGLIADFLLSCRVMGRKIEESLLHAAIKHLTSRGVSRVTARYVPTSRNAPMGSFLRKSGLTEIYENTFSWSTGTPYASPDCLQLNLPDDFPTQSHVM